ncbi:PD40 domain-containing protein [Sulfidibacter corallicola]|uniref:PD40 domain-containing protein n=1 Tax=Sulfidibacter corallicola TaxID=2818388 RepID=A0A8A4THE7_SULCO|nr:DPP IV N-terminal domain-containing protein [Sulfidibacter corallicola]QTD48970.1 PD40 domain-containing protein [Sulfidibacter corallicola]
MSVLRLFMMIMGCAALVVAGESAPPQSLQIAYNVFEDPATDNYEIYVMNADGSGKRNISNWKGVDWVYLAVGDKLYFVSDRDAKHREFHLYEMRADGSGVRRMTDFLVVDSWLSSRRNGTQFVVCSAKDGKDHELYLIDASGRELKRLTDNDRYENDPVFSPDGSQIVYRSKRSGKDELWIRATDGGQERQLTFYPESDDSLADGRGFHAGPPFWVARRNQITFASKRNGNYSIFAVRPDGSREQQLTDDRADEMWHSWSPDGRWLAYDRTEDGKSWRIYLHDMKSGKARALTGDGPLALAPVIVGRTQATPGN